jgi:glutathione S-transferase
VPVERQWIPNSSVSCYDVCRHLLDAPIASHLLVHSGQSAFSHWPSAKDRSMNYLSVEDARDLPGLRLALTAGVPGPWSEAAKAVFRHHGVEYVPVRQQGAGENPELIAWTGHRNAPVAVYGDEPPRVRWQEILDLAERLGAGPALLPGDREARIRTIGICSEIAGEGGFAWNCRLLMFDQMVGAVGVERARRNPMLKDYQYDPGQAERTTQKVRDFIAFLAGCLGTGGDYIIGDQFTAADLYWAYFSNLLSPMPHEVNPMPDALRQSYHLPAKAIGDFDPIVIGHRDAIFERHLELPLTF